MATRKRAAGLAVATALGALGAAAATLGLASGAAAQHVAKNPEAIQCPAPPAGWSKPPVVRNVSTPQTTKNGYGGNYEQVAAGGNSATVTCAYHDTASKQVYVEVSFALPTDPNPFHDFALGCGKGDAPWSAAYRTYRVSSPRQWALAVFVDTAAYLKPHEVPLFQQLARRLLQNAEGYGHRCGVTVRPTAVPARFFFDVRAGDANIKSTFWTPPSPNAQGVFRITKSTPARARLHVDTKDGERVLAIRLGKGIDYRLQGAHGPARARFHVVVTGSSVRACRKGAGGTLTLTAPIDVAVAVCGQTFRPVATSLVAFHTA